LLGGLVLTLLAAAGGCGKGEESPPKEKPKEKTEATPPRARVTLVRPLRKDLRYTLSRPGFIEAYEHTRMYAKLAGYVEKVNVDIGDTLKEGQSLAEIGIPEMRVELKQKEALVSQAEANLGSARAKVKTAEAGIVRARADVRRWTVEQRRQARMVQRGTLDQQSLDAVEAALEAARAAEEEAKAQVLKATADVGVAQENVRVAKANKDYVAALLQYTTIKAPYQGVVIHRSVNKGDFVQPAAGGGKGDALFVVARTDKGLRIFVDVPEGSATSIKENTRATVQAPRAAPGVEVEGQVTRSSWALDQSARTLRTEIHLQNPGKLRPGMYAYVTLTTEHHQVWTLPASALVTKDNQVSCFVVRGGKAVKTAVRIGSGDGKRVEVFQVQRKRDSAGKLLWQDVTGNERVIRNPEKVTDGQPIRVSSR
jgi:multidrug efflux pump subunit AcrA (membrane-fusion protein)